MPLAAFPAAVSGLLRGSVAGVVLSHGAAGASIASLCIIGQCDCACCLGAPSACAAELARRGYRHPQNPRRVGGAQPPCWLASRTASSRQRCLTGHGGGALSPARPMVRPCRLHSGRCTGCRYPSALAPSVAFEPQPVCRAISRSSALSSGGVQHRILRLGQQLRIVQRVVQATRFLALHG